MKKRIFFYCSSSNLPSGGRKMIYQIVDLINNSDFEHEAYVLHNKPNFRLSWFHNTTKVKSIRLYASRSKKTILKKKIDWLLNDIILKKTNEVLLSNQDVIFLAETQIEISKFFTNNSVIIFNQNPFFFLKKSYPKRLIFDKENNMIYKFFCYSESNYKIFTSIFPNINARHGQLYIDETKFFYKKKKKMQILYMPRRRKDDFSLLSTLIKYDHKFNDIEFIPLENMNQSEIAEKMRESLFFLSFSYKEGFGLPPAEAMACGCIVIGYTGIAGLEYFNKDYCFPIEEENIFEYYLTLSECMSLVKNDYNYFDQMRKNASDKILKKYSKLNSQKINLSSIRELIKD